MIALLLLSLAAQARTVGLVVGANEFWKDGCVSSPADPGACLDASQTLHYADDDAWRAAYFLQTITPEDNIRVLAEPDESTQGRAYPGGTPGAPTSVNLLATLHALRGDPTGEPVTVIVFIAAHGSPEEVHLADGKHSFQALRQDILAQLGPKDELVLVADACNSARWRSGDYSVKPMSYFPPVQRSQGRTIEALVDGITPEDDEILGGVFTYLTLSAWMGGADANEDGDISTQELQDLLFRYAAAGSQAPFAPVVRSPDGLSNRLLPDRPLGGAIALGDAEAARWLVLAQGEGLPTAGVPIGEVFTGPGKSAAIEVPAGRYRLVRLPCTWNPIRRAFSALGDDAFVYAAEVKPGESVELEGPGERIGLGRKGGRGELGTTVDNLPVAALQALPQDRARYHGGARWWVGAGVGAATPAMFDAGRDAPLLGVNVSLRHPLAGGRLQVSGTGGWMTEVAETQPSTLQMATFGASANLLLVSRPHLYAGPVGGALLDVGQLTTTQDSRSFAASYIAPGAQAGARVSLVQGRTQWYGSALWTPVWVSVDDEGDPALERWHAEPVQFRITVGGEIIW